MHFQWRVEKTLVFFGLRRLIALRTDSADADDFVSVGNQMEIVLAGTSNGKLEIEINDDEHFESTEHLSVKISSTSLVGVTETGSTLQARVEIVDNDTIPTIAIEDVQAIEDNGSVEISYTLSSPSSRESRFCVVDS